ncbi:very short patch repair endonuclease [Parabacteroides bouchesdurhonensis]|uniref:very short patch repair endonuclease n=1 Tax=Parabacteroides bouchesdurhonensis TaxID=1936995 RepID=UPI000C844BD1|nr:DNA mismatch endonuclease Vsr [Parabacteroides bouchesdurhonensis]
MADVHSKEIRSYNMSRIRGKNTKPEILIRKSLFSKGFRYNLHSKNLPGKPDIVLPKYKTVIFVHGCFWHGHEGCQYYVIPKTRTEFWLNKINTNIQNDMKNLISLKNMGWNVITIWECETKKKNNIKVLIDQIEKELYNNLMSNKNTSCKI